MYMGTTTIQVNEETKNLLNEYKKSYNLKTYDDVIKVLARKKNMKSMYGFLKKYNFSREEMYKDLRDKHD